MKLSEKKFICDIAGILFAGGVLCSSCFVFFSLEQYMHMMPLVFGFGALMLVTLCVRFCLVGRKRCAWGCGILTGVLVIFCVISVVCPKGV
ncbi:MAG: hypothetical protein SPF60_06750 [Lachnospiraceae bacterium]|nr:hypothetical protein [Oscillospiraceae bacterium]MDY5541104.1 hypothetical protein [Lachnospiraceae bacterium]